MDMAMVFRRMGCLAEAVEDQFQRDQKGFSLEMVVIVVLGKITVE